MCMMYCLEKPQKFEKTALQLIQKHFKLKVQKPTQFLQNWIRLCLGSGALLWWARGGDIGDVGGGKRGSVYRHSVVGKEVRACADAEAGAQSLVDGVRCRKMWGEVHPVDLITCSPIPFQTGRLHHHRVGVETSNYFNEI